MAKAFRCDCCGEFFTSEDKIYLVNFIEQHRHSGIETQAVFDICKDCFDAMFKNFKNEGKEE